MEGKKVGKIILVNISSLSHGDIPVSSDAGWENRNGLQQAVHNLILL